MNRNLRAPATAGALWILFAARLVLADTPPSATPPAGSSTDAAMAAEMMKYANPGPEHAMLKPMVGTFDAVVKQWSGGPEPTVSKGVMKNAMVLGGRYLESRYKGTYQGQPMEGYGLLGYDVRNKSMVSMWFDTMTTGPMTENGSISADGKEIDCTGSVPAPGGGTLATRSVTKIEGADKYVYSMFGKIGEQEFPFMEITYTRAKK